MKLAVCLSVLVGVFLTMPCDAWWMWTPPPTCPTTGVVPTCGACSCNCDCGYMYQHGTPSANGCGAGYLQVIVGVSTGLIPDGFQSCCRDHDKCYDTCGKSKSACDNEFCACMSAVCDSKSIFDQIGCWPVKEGFCIGINNAGCDAFTAAQKNICRCS